MNNWMDLIACPACRGGLSLKVFVPRAALLAEEGVLTCQKCGMWYPITQGIPRLLIPGPLRSNDPAFLKKWKLRPSERGRRRSPDENDALVTQSQVQKVFAFKWKSQKDWGIHGGAAKFMRKWSFEKYGWKNDRDYQAFSKTKRVMLDAGCGLGREAMRMAASNDAARVVGLELSACVEEARAHADEKKLKNLLLVQGDIMYPPFKKSVFDFVYSEGVLHHTSNTRTAVQRMADLLGRGGEFAFYVYRKKAPLREFADDYVRDQLQKVPLKEALRMMEPLTRLGKALSDKKIRIRVPADVPVLGLRSGRYDFQRWVYNAMFKCFWSDAMSFKENVLVNFDWYMPRFAWRHTEQEVRQWLKEMKLLIKREFVEDAGITIRAVRKSRRK